MLRQTDSPLVETKDLVKDPYASILGFPRCDRKELEDRIQELCEFRVDGLVFDGKTKIGRLGVLGKGCVSVVVQTLQDGRLCALKIRRTDADRDDMRREGNFLRVANEVGVGPSLLGATKNFLLMELINGVNMSSFLHAVNNRKELANAVSAILNQCHELDAIGLDHGELSDMKHHAIIGDDVTLIDFESASLNRRVANVTTASQYLFIGGYFANKVRNMLNIDSVAPVVQMLKEYKRDRTKENLERLKQVTNI